MKRKRYRYILSGGIKPEDPVNWYRLIANRAYAAFSCIRICVDDIELSKYVCDSYSTTKDTRSIVDIDYDIFVHMSGKWRLRNDLKPEDPSKSLSDIIDKQMEKEGRMIGLHSWITREEYREIWKSPK